MVRQYSNGDIDAVMQIWLDTNIRAHHFIPSDYWRTNCDMVRELLSHAEIYVHEDECAKQIDGFIGLNDDYIEGIFVKETMQSKGIGKQLLNHVKKVKPTLKLNVYQKNEKAIKFYLREKFNIRSENIDDNTGEKEFVMVWN
ncbi:MULTISPECIES: GNAT family N-acetyltransferase [unclassified Clostridium]|uniref:GNAT family N-acetyltransferase n=1 Tax=unclassified Clostridium TaxID=2614128 RepID=UPI000E52E47B|nr:MULTISPECIES: GNAT family N-acetyltransferase [unclassified Clostridium]RHP41630.1 GNAT family N-acetyltransferase [Clostridium sp. AF32-12BH]RHS84391.1 GNAT family N-acetyltransferase [Clostridium sp. AM42-4]RHV86334.1 GNAT family N-acetyltransferase [Clostridium sp. OF09-36]